MVVKKKFADNAGFIAPNETQSACLEVKVKTIASSDKFWVGHYHGLIGKGLLAIGIDTQFGRFNA